MVTCSKAGNLKPRVFLAYIEPHSVKQALAHPKWFDAMKAE